MHLKSHRISLYLAGAQVLSACHLGVQFVDFVVYFKDDFFIKKKQNNSIIHDNRHFPKFFVKNSENNSKQKQQQERRRCYQQGIESRSLLCKKLNAYILTQINKLIN